MLCRSAIRRLASVAPYRKHAASQVRTFVGSHLRQDAEPAGNSIDLPHKGYSPKVQALVDQIAQLNLIEVSELIDCLQVTLKIEDMPMMPMGMPMQGMAQAGAGAGAAAAEEPKKEEKKEFDVKLKGYDAKDKIKIIKEVRAATGLGLKEAKDLVEGAPALIKKGLKKEDADQLVEKLKAVGAQIELE